MTPALSTVTSSTVPDYVPRPWLAEDTVRRAHVDLDNAWPIVDARAFVLAAAWDWHLSADVREVLRLVVDELVANVEQHAIRINGWHTVPVRIERHPHRIVIEVADPDPTMPVWSGAEPFGLDDVDRHPEDAPVLIGGRGGSILAGLCEHFGARRQGEGKVVRAVVALADPRHAVSRFRGPTDEELVDAYVEFFGVRLLDRVVESSDSRAGGIR